MRGLKSDVQKACFADQRCQVERCPVDGEIAQVRSFDVILEIGEQEIIERVGDVGHAAAVPHGRDDAHLALIEVGCSAPGEPPVDPRRIRSAGMVIRRVINGIEHRWVKRDGKVVGWVAHSEAQRDDDDVYEPDPVRRAQRLDDPTRRLLMLDSKKFKKLKYITINILTINKVKQTI